MSNKENRLMAENGRLRDLLAQAGVDAARNGVAQSLQRLMLEELHHRVKNTLVIVQAVVSQSLTGATSVKDARRAIETRLVALGQVHDLLLQTNWAEADLKAILQTAVTPFSADRFVIVCPSIEVAAATALPLGMVLNELCTNAIKYGALSNSDGFVSIAAAMEGDGRTLGIHWKETGGPPVAPPSRRSFGTRLIEQSLVGPLGGQVALEFPVDGVACTVRMAMDALRH